MLYVWIRKGRSIQRNAKRRKPSFLGPISRDGSISCQYQHLQWDAGLLLRTHLLDMYNNFRNRCSLYFLMTIAQFYIDLVRLCNYVPIEWRVILVYDKAECRQYLLMITTKSLHRRRCPRRRFHRRRNSFLTTFISVEELFSQVSSFVLGSSQNLAAHASHQTVQLLHGTPLHLPHRSKHFLVQAS